MLKQTLIIATLITQISLLGQYTYIKRGIQLNWTERGIDAPMSYYDIELNRNKMGKRMILNHKSSNLNLIQYFPKNYTSFEPLFFKSNRLQNIVNYSYFNPGSHQLLLNLKNKKTQFYSNLEHINLTTKNINRAFNVPEKTNYEVSVVRNLYRKKVNQYNKNLNLTLMNSYNNEQNKNSLQINDSIFSKFSDKNLFIANAINYNISNFNQNELMEFNTSLQSSYYKSKLIKFGLDTINQAQKYIHLNTYFNKTIYTNKFEIGNNLFYRESNENFQNIKFNQKTYNAGLWGKYIKKFNQVLTGDVFIRTDYAEKNLNQSYALNLNLEYKKVNVKLNFNQFFNDDNSVIENIKPFILNNLNINFQNKLKNEKGKQIGLFSYFRINNGHLENTFQFNTLYTIHDNKTMYYFNSDSLKLNIIQIKDNSKQLHFKWKLLRRKYYNRNRIEFENHFNYSYLGLNKNKNSLHQNKHFFYNQTTFHYKSKTLYYLLEIDNAFIDGRPVIMSEKNNEINYFITDVKLKIHKRKYNYKIHRHKEIGVIISCYDVFNKLPNNYLQLENNKKNINGFYQSRKNDNQKLGMTLYYQF